MWTKEMEEKLDELFKKEFTAGQIAKALTSQFGTRFTKNAIIGKCFRSGLKFPKGEKIKEARRKNLQEKQNTVPSVKQIKMSQVFSQSQLAEEDWEFAIEIPVVKIHNNCQFPIANKGLNTIFCNNPIDKKKYCKEHFEITHKLA